MATRTIDTNILLRLLIDDHSQQGVVAAALAARFQLVVLPTVVLETEWVLRSRYLFDRPTIVELLRRVTDYDGFIVIERQRLSRAVDAFSKGMDFADALHLCLTAAGETFVTFDRDLVRLAARHINHASVELAS